MIDTGGIEPDSKDIILSQMREQAQIAIDTADVIVMIVDVRQGLVDADAKVADLLRRSKKPVVLAVNKVDNFQKFMMDVYEFYNLGLGEPVPISAASRLGLGDLLDEVIRYFPANSQEETEDERPKVAIIGKPNTGKSSLINKLCGKDRVIVSDIAGTTRDAVDTEVTFHGQEYVLIDTAGIRRKSKKSENGASLMGMAWSNLWRNRKRTVLVILSLTLGMVLMSFFYAKNASFDMEKYLIDLSAADFQIDDAANQRAEGYDGRQRCTRY